MSDLTPSAAATPDSAAIEAAINSVLAFYHLRHCGNGPHTSTCRAADEGLAALRAEVERLRNELLKRAPSWTALRDARDLAERRVAELENSLRLNIRAANELQRINAESEAALSARVVELERENERLREAVAR